jgi:hypothetical protein
MRIPTSAVYTFAVATLTLTVGVATPVFSAVTTCGTTCTSDCELGANLSCTPSQNGVTLSNGADLDMKGYNIECNSNTSACGTAIRMTAANSVVRNTVAETYTDPGPYILRGWSVGIDCDVTNGAGQSGSAVLGIKMRGYWQFGAIVNCQTVDGNAIIGMPAPSTTPLSFFHLPPTGIVHGNVSNSDAIVNNFISNVETGIMRYPDGPSTTLTISNNTFNVYDLSVITTAYNGSPIDLLNGSTQAATITDNIFTGDARLPVIRLDSGEESVTTVSNNVCKSPLFGCSACVSDGLCDAEGVCVSP